MGYVVGEILSTVYLGIGMYDMTIGRPNWKNSCHNYLEMLNDKFTFDICTFYFNYHRDCHIRTVNCKPIQL